MRYWLVSLAIPVVVVCGLSVGIVGCSKAPNTDDRQVKVETDGKPQQAPVKDPVVKDPAAKEPIAKAPPAKDAVRTDPAEKTPTPKDPVVENPPAKEPTAKDPTPIEPTEIAVKEKEKTKEPGKDPKKDPQKVESKTPEFKEPKDIGGKSFDVWRKEIKSPDPSKREAAMKMILGFGPNKCYEVVPDLIGELKKHKPLTPIDLAVRINGLEALTIILSAKKDPEQKDLNDAVAVYKTFLTDTQIVVRLTAVRGLPNLGPTGRTAIDEVIKLCGDPVTYEVRKDAITVLIMMAPIDEKGAMEPKVMPVLKKAAATDNSYLVRINAFQGITMVGRDPLLRDTALLDLRRPLLPATFDPSFLVRQTALQGLAMLGQEKAIPDARKALDDGSKEVRLTAVNTLVGLKKHLQGKDGAKERNTTLTRLSTHIGIEKEPIIRIWARGAIMVIDKIDKVHMAALVKDFQTHKDPAVRLEALKVISGFEDKAKPFAYEAVLGCIEDADLNIAVACMMTLVQMYAYEATPHLEKLKDNMKANQILRDAAEETLEAFVLQRAEKTKKDKDKKTP